MAPYPKEDKPTPVVPANAPQYNAPVRTPLPPLPLRRWSSNLLCGLSLLIFLLAMGIWVRSYFYAESLGRGNSWTDPTDQSFPARGVGYALMWECGTISVMRNAVRTTGFYPPESEW